jgi:hypothetical protein
VFVAQIVAKRNLRSARSAGLPAVEQAIVVFVACSGAGRHRSPS